MLELVENDVIYISTSNVNRDLCYNFDHNLILLYHKLTIILVYTFVAIVYKKFPSIYYRLLDDKTTCVYIVYI